MRRSKRKRCIDICFAFFMIFNCIIMFGGRTVYAQPSVSVTLPVEQAFLLDEVPVNESQTTFQYELRPVGTATPMPHGSGGDVYVVELTGNDLIMPTPIVYDSAGVYTYMFKAAAENDTTGYVPGEEEYQIEIYVHEEANGNLRAVTIVKNGAGMKVSVLGFIYHIADATGSGSDDGTNGDGGSNNGGDLGGGNGLDNGTGLGGDSSLAGNAGDGLGQGGSSDQDDSTRNQESGNRAKGDTVNTGDSAAAYIWWGIAIVMCAVIIVTLVKKRCSFHKM